MKVYVFPADLEACGHFRLIWPSDILKSQGVDIEVIWPFQRDEYLQMAIDKFTGEPISVVIPEDADVIVMQRVTHARIVQAIPMIRARGVAVIMEVDDDLTAIHEKNPANYLNPKLKVMPDHNWRNTMLACHASSVVMVSAHALLPIYAPHGRGMVVNNCVPKKYLEIPHQDSDIIGWGGSVHSHPNDLQVMGTAIQRLQREGHIFRVCGNGDDVQKILRLDEPPDITGALHMFEAWPWTLATLGIGVAPLADTKFNRSKSWLKPLEMAALGVPPVVSPRIEYASLMEKGIGISAHKGKDWYDRLKMLATRPDIRQEMSEKGRSVAADWTIEGNAWRWLECFEAAYKFERTGTF